MTTQLNMNDNEPWDAYHCIGCFQKGPWEADSDYCDTCRPLITETRSENCWACNEPGLL